MAEAGVRGRCLCGAVRYDTRTSPAWTALCHCESCRRSASAPVVAWMGFAEEDVSFQGPLKSYKSSEIGTRWCCAECGTQMLFKSTRWPGEAHLYAASLDDPEQYVPQLHCHVAEQLTWLHLDDTLPRHKRSAEI